MDRFEETKLKVKEANDIVALIEGYLPLRRAGRNMVGLCPFHPEKTPSFTVHPDSQHFMCYGCRKAGDVFTFLMEREGLDFKEAFAQLAQRAGISIDGVFGAPRRDKPRVDPHATLAQVRDFFAQTLSGEDGQAARNYLQSRGLLDAADTFGLGAHPAAPGALSRFAEQRRLSHQVLEQAGLLRGRVEPFRGRVMFPIEDPRGRVVGFGGRTLESGPPKYINSPESPFFLKREVLYGLRQVKAAGERRVVVMEGYTDVVACHLAGFRGAVATLGTALTPGHGKVLTRYATDGVVLLFDGDRAGRAAAEKAYSELVKTELPLKMALLDDGMDPADVLAQPGRSNDESAAASARFAAVIDSAEDALVTWFRLKRQRVDLTLEDNVQRAVQECGRVLDAIEEPTRRQILLGRMARQLGIDDRDMARTLGRPRRRPAARAEAGAGTQPALELSPMAKADVDLLACVVADPALAIRVEEEAGEGELSGIAKLLEFAADAVAAGAVSSDDLLRQLFASCAERPEMAQVVAQAAERAPRIPDPDEAFGLLCRHRRAYLARQAAQQIRYELQQARDRGDQRQIDELTRRYVTHLQQDEPG